MSEFLVLQQTRRNASALTLSFTQDAAHKIAKFALWGKQQSEPYAFISDDEIDAFLRFLDGDNNYYAFDAFECAWKARDIWIRLNLSLAVRGPHIGGSFMISGRDARRMLYWIKDRASLGTATDTGSNEPQVVPLPSPPVPEKISSDNELTIWPDSYIKMNRYG